MSIKAHRLKTAREKAGYSSAADAARAFGWPEPAYRHHENGTRGFGPDAAKKYGRAFKVKPGWLLALERVEANARSIILSDDTLVVNCGVQAGAWLVSEEWNDDRAFEIVGMPPLVPGARRFGMVVIGNSMDVFYEEGTVLDCTSIFDNGVPPKSGDHVIVECVRPDGLRELTVKEYLEEDGKFWLVPRSRSPKYQRVAYPGPDNAHAGDDRVNVIAFVMAAYPPRTLDLMRRMGMIRPLAK